MGRRQSKTVNGITTAFLYDGLNVVQELTDGTPTANLLTGLGIDETLLRTDAAGPRAFLADGLGSTLALTDSAGLIQSEYTYEPFGKTTATGEASTNAFTYTGREDDGTGLYYYRARYYHPALQRFISEDPIGFDGGDVNLYGYVGNGPVNFTDPSGLFAPAIAACLLNPACGAAVVGTAGYILGQALHHAGKRRQNWLPEQGVPGTVCTNPPGTQKRKYGADGWPEKDWNKGHGPTAPPDEQDDHVHDWTPNPHHPGGRPNRGKGRAPKPGEMGDF